MRGVSLVRFFSLHFILPFFLVVLVGAHVFVLHLVHSNSPLHLKGEGVKFSSFFLLKDFLRVSFWFIVLRFVLFFFSYVFLEKEMFEVANPLMSPEHIVPE
ncbi:MAG: ubiquinol-cytochrome c reductase cytochrome b subunit [Ignavibacteria bacterium]|nr:MAG: ubiquinol-cytochrome c reductase cytochrome b subunit [Ignavibacteria bacterium]